MSTNAGIAVKTGGTFQTIYCHWDGSPNYMLPMLRNNYNSLELATKLVSMGYASIIEKKLEPDPSKPHDFDHYQEDVCVFYHRDRGDDWESYSPVCYSKRELFQVPAFDYVYIFENGQWTAYTGRGTKLNV